MLAPGDKLFRTAALKRLRSPEDLDQLVRLTKPKGWVAGAAIAALIAAVLAWSIFGHLPTRVSGKGLLMSQGGRVVEVQSRGAGVLTELLAVTGERVTQGQVVARLGETEGERELRTRREQLEERRRDLALARSGLEGERVLRAESLRRQRATLELRVRTARDREAVLQERLSTTQSLFAERLVTRAQVIATQNELASVRQELSNTASDAARLGAEEAELARVAEERVRERERLVDEAERAVASLAEGLGGQLVLRAPSAGVVLETRAQPGSLLRPGQAVLALNQEGDGLEALVFIDSQNGKRLAPGMPVRLALASARREEFGTMEGEVVSVSDFPLSLDAVRAMIQNEELARSFVEGGPPFLARVRLLRDAATASGYRWTSQRGGAIALSSGISATADIITEQRRPISLAIPALRQWLGY